MAPILKAGRWEGGLGSFVTTAKTRKETHRELYPALRKQSQYEEISCLTSKFRKWALEGSARLPVKNRTP